MSKTAVRQKVDRFLTASGGRLSVLSSYYAASNNELNVEINAFVSYHREREALPALTTNSTLTARPGLHVDVESYGSWARYTRLSNDLYIELLPALGAGRRGEVDIKCFLEHHTENGPTVERRYRIRYFVPVTLSSKVTA